MKLAFTLCSNNYLAQASVLAASFLNFNPGYRFIIGLSDKLYPDIDYTYFQPADVITVFEIGISNIEQLIKKYSIVEFNTAVKPFYFDFLFDKYSPDHIIYLDPDIAVYSEFQEIDEILKLHNFILTPHLLQINPQKEPEKEKLVLNVGIFNLGFLGLKNDYDARLMLKWWKDRMKHYCYIDFCNGLFVDQIWANYIPSYFDSYSILKSAGYNVGYWNFDERILRKDNNTYLVNDSEKLIFFHFSNFNPLQRHKLCKWLNYSFEKRPDLFELYQEYSDMLLSSNFEIFSNLKPLLSFKPISPEEREIKPLSLKQKIGSKLKRASNKTLNRLFDLE